MDKKNKNSQKQNKNDYIFTAKMIGVFFAVVLTIGLILLYFYKQEVDKYDVQMNKNFEELELSVDEDTYHVYYDELNRSVRRIDEDTTCFYDLLITSVKKYDSEATSYFKKYVGNDDIKEVEINGEKLLYYTNQKDDESTKYDYKYLAESKNYFYTLEFTYAKNNDKCNKERADIINTIQVEH